MTQLRKTENKFSNEYIGVHLLKFTLDTHPGSLMHYWNFQLEFVMPKAQFRRRSFHEPNLIRIWVDLNQEIPPFDSDAVLIQPNLIQLKQIKCAGQLFSAQLLDKFIQKTL